MSRTPIRLAALSFILLIAACAPRLLPSGPLADAPQVPGLRDGALQTADGLALPVRSWLPNPHSPKAVVIALHGFNDYSNAFAAPGEWLADQGIAVYAYDQRGFGAAPRPGMWAGGKQLTADLRGMVTAVRDRHPDLPLYVLGESMGGTVAMTAIAEGALNVDGIILAGPAVRGRAVIPAYQQAVLWLVAHTLPWMTVTGEGVRVTPSDNIEMLRALSRDPLIIRATRIDAIWGLVELMDDALTASPSLDAPMLLLYGQRDDIIPPNAALEMLRRLPAKPMHDRTVAVYQDGYHMLLRDLQGEVVWRDVAAWIDDPTAALPSGADQVDPVLALAGG